MAKKPPYKDVTNEFFDTPVSDLIRFKPMPYELTEKQKRFIALAKDGHTKALFSQGLPGTGRTLLSVYAALLLVKSGKFEEITYVRNPVQTAFEDMGYMPGSGAEKFAPFADVLWEKCEELLTEESYAEIRKKSIIKAEPTSFLRGRTLNGVVIVDEAQSINKKSLKNVLTRIGSEGKLILIGDDDQKDIPDKHSGFAELIKTFKDQESRDFGIHTIEFMDEEDVKRSELVKFIIKKMNAMERYAEENHRVVSGSYLHDWVPQKE